MTHCAQRRRLHDWLDGALETAEAERYAEHLAGCESCTAELAAFTRVEARIAGARVIDPGPALTERILDRVVPSRVRRRFVTVVGWTYTAATAVTTFAFFSWVTRPTTPAWLADQFGQLYLGAIRAGLLTLHTLVTATLRMGDGWGLLDTFAGRLAPLARAAMLTLSQPVVGATVAAAMISTVALLRWLRPRNAGAEDGLDHVDLLGF